MSIQACQSTMKGIGSPTNEDFCSVIRGHDGQIIAVVLADGAGRAGGAARKACTQFQRILDAQTYLQSDNLNTWNRMIRTLDSFLMGVGKSTFVAYTIHVKDEKPIVYGTAVGDAKLIHVNRDGKWTLYPPMTRKGFLGTGQAEPAGFVIRPDKGDHILTLSDGAYSALGGAEKIARLLMRLKLQISIYDIPQAMLGTAKQLLDDSTIAVARF